MSGEQFALPDAVDRLREVRRTANDGRLHSISTADPLNLAGIVTPGERVRAAARTTLVYRDGVPIAAIEAELFRELVPLDTETRVSIDRAVRRGGTVQIARV
jgi:ATP-dependent Lhr-like helicase